jgi:hypothetical protein
MIRGRMDQEEGIMLWYYNKLSEDDDRVVYTYRWNAKEYTGQLMYDKKKDNYVIIKPADNDNEFGANWALGHLAAKIDEEGFKDKFIVAIVEWDVSEFLCKWQFII